MLTYQFREHQFRLEGGHTSLEFPAMTEIEMHFLPLQPFGMEAGGGRTLVKAEAATLHFNANNGRQLVESHKPLQPLDVTLQAPDQTTILKGNCLQYRQICQQIGEVAGIIESLYIAMPVLLAVEFADPPYVSHVRGKIGDVPFRWELKGWTGPIDGTTQDHQEERFSNAWENIQLVSEGKRRRLLAALHYFHVACRLNRVSETPGEFLPESLLNFHKILEVLYGPNRDAVRAGLAKLGYDSIVIEADFIPVMLLRNSFDVGHPLLALFKRKDLEVLHAYADKAESVFRGFFQKHFEAIKSGSAETAHCDILPVDASTRKTIEVIRQNLEIRGEDKDVRRVKKAF